MLGLSYEHTLIHNRLDRLVDVVVYVLAGYDRCHGAGMLTLDTLLHVLELGLLSSQAALDFLRAVMIEVAVLNRDDVVVVSLRKDSLVVDRLYGGVVVILVNLLVNRRLHVLVFRAVDGLVCDSGRDLLMHGCVMVASFGHEVPNCCLG
jgi:hypothetical protein